jgi:coenzyme F420-reducing hydrogenase beta subunit
MKLLFEEILMLASNDICCGCGVCSAKCPKKAIRMEPNEEGFLYPYIEARNCVRCGACEKSCPVLKGASPSKHDIAAYAAYLNDPNLLQLSSSGGAFFAFANSVISDGGVVYGAVYDSDFKRVMHVKGTTLAEIVKMRGSKYIQSEKNDIYNLVAESVAGEKIVLFTGLPCEIAALKAFLNRNPQNLITCELICHGPTSPQVAADYLTAMEQSTHSKLLDFSARYKKSGWSPAYMKVVLDSGKIIVKKFERTAYGFAVNHFCRPSCYRCLYKGDHRVADITIGDFWGIDPNAPYYNKNGVSVIFVHTKKGADYLRNVSGLQIMQVDSTKAKKGNPNIYSSAVISDLREKFFSLWKTKGLKRAARKLNKPKTLKDFIKKYLPHNVRIFKKKLHDMLAAKFRDITHR